MAYHMGYFGRVTIWRNVWVLERSVSYAIFPVQQWEYCRGFLETDAIEWLERAEQGDIGFTRGSTHTSLPRFGPSLRGLVVQPAHLGLPGWVFPHQSPVHLFTLIATFIHHFSSSLLHGSIFIIHLFHYTINRFVFCETGKIDNLSAVGGKVFWLSVCRSTSIEG